MIAGLEEISRGEVSIGDKVVNRMAPKERDIAMVFQNYALYPHMTVREQHVLRVDAGEAAEGRDRRAREEGRRHRSALSPTSTAIHGNCPEASGSGVAMGRAIVRDPQVFLFDEPAVEPRREAARADAHGDQGLHQRLKTHVHLRHPRSDRGHDAWPDKIVVMRDGVVEQTGDPLGLYDQTREHLCRRLHRLPAMNMIPGTARIGDAATQSRIRRRRDTAHCLEARAPTPGRRCSTAFVRNISRYRRDRRARRGHRSSSLQARTRSSTARFNGQEVTATIPDAPVPSSDQSISPDLTGAHFSQRR